MSDGSVTQNKRNINIHLCYIKLQLWKRAILNCLRKNTNSPLPEKESFIIKPRFVFLPNSYEKNTQ